jgi:uncharacterized protein (DUF1330 family)
MPAYVIVDIHVNDAIGYDEYKNLAPPSIAAHGGKYLARGGQTEVLEGAWSPSRLVILQFETIEQARKWLNSVEYRAARELRHKTATSNMVVIEGVEYDPDS